MYYKRKYYSTPLGSTFAVVRLWLASITPLTAITGMRGAAGGRQPAAAKPPLPPCTYHVSWSQRWFHSFSDSDLS